VDLQHIRNSNSGDTAKQKPMSRGWQYYYGKYRYAVHAVATRCRCPLRRVSVSQSIALRPSVRPSARPSHDGQLDAANLFMDDGPICLLARPTTGLLSNAARRVAHGGKEGRDRLPARAS